MHVCMQEFESWNTRIHVLLFLRIILSAMLGWPDWTLKRETVYSALEALLQVELLYNILTLKEAPILSKLD